MATQGKPEPVSPLYYIDGTGFMARLYTDGWHCTCYKPGCEHVKVAEKTHKEAGAPKVEAAKEETK